MALPGGALDENSHGNTQSQTYPPNTTDLGIPGAGQFGQNANENTGLEHYEDGVQLKHNGARKEGSSNCPSDDQGLKGGQ